MLSVLPAAVFRRIFTKENKIFSKEKKILSKENFTESSIQFYGKQYSVFSATAFRLISSSSPFYRQRLRMMNLVFLVSFKPNGAEQ
jgi:hypothetical protein